MRRHDVVVMLTVAVLVLAATFGAKALIGPYTDQGRAQAYFENRIDALGQHLAKSWKGRSLTPATAADTKDRVLAVCLDSFACEPGPKHV